MIVRDESTGKSWDFPTTSEGYAEARTKIQAIAEQGHKVGDDHYGTIKKVDDYYNGNLFRR